MSDDPAWLHRLPSGLQVWFDHEIESSGGDLASALDALATATSARIERALFDAGIPAAVRGSSWHSGRAAQGPRLSLKIDWVEFGSWRLSPQELRRWQQVVRDRGSVMRHADVIIAVAGDPDDAAVIGHQLAPDPAVREVFNRAVFAAVAAQLRGPLARDNPRIVGHTRRMAHAKKTKRRPSRYAYHVVQSILVPLSHKDVRARGLAGARMVAARHGGRPGGKVEKTARFYRFRQRDPRGMVPGSYVTLTLPSGTRIVKALPASRVSPRRASGARANPSPGRWTVTPRARTLLERRDLSPAMLLDADELDLVRAALDAGVSVRFGTRGRGSAEVVTVHARPHGGPRAAHADEARDAVDMLVASGWDEDETGRGAERLLTLTLHGARANPRGSRGGRRASAAIPSGRREVHTVFEQRSGQWLNRGLGGNVASRHRLKRAAVAAGRVLARRVRAEHVIHRTDGVISEKNSYGRDAFPPRG
jgi:hypothetical protein